jgi:hypothetical protein
MNAHEAALVVLATVFPAATITADGPADPHPEPRPVVTGWAGAGGAVWIGAAS